jgi:hypothetical protein
MNQKFAAVMSKARKQAGQIYPSVKTKFEAAIEKNDSISIRCVDGYDTGKENTFRLGEMAEYDSYNLSYYGPIVAISEKTISIISKYDQAKFARGDKVRVHRLDLYSFAWRNISFDVIKQAASNAETSMYI